MSALIESSTCVPPGSVCDPQEKVQKYSRGLQPYSLTDETGPGSVAEDVTVRPYAEPPEKLKVG